MLLSIIIPVYNGEKFVKRCLESILSASKDSDYEIIIINNGSTDSSATVLEPYRKYDNIKLLYTEVSGVSNARNLGLQIAQGKYIYFCDADDYICADYFNVVFPYLRDDIDIITFGYKIITEDKQLLDICVLNDKDSFTVNDFPKYIICDDKIGGFVWNKIYKYDIINQCFDVELSICEDLSFNVMLFNTNKKVTIKYLPITLYNYVVNLNSSSRRINNLFTIDYKYKYSITFEKLIQQAPYQFLHDIKAKYFLCTLGTFLDNVNYQGLNNICIAILKSIMRKYYIFFITNSSFTILEKVKYSLFYFMPILKKISAKI